MRPSWDSTTRSRRMATPLRFRHTPTATPSSAINKTSMSIIQAVSQDATIVGFDNTIAPNGYTITLPPHSDGDTNVGDQQNINVNYSGGEPGCDHRGIRQHDRAEWLHHYASATLRRRHQRRR